MRRTLCLAMPLRSDDSVGAKGTLATLMHLGYAARHLDVDLEFLPISGAPHALARNIILASFLSQYKADDLLCLDYGNSVASGDDYVLTQTLLRVLLTSQEEALVCPTPKRAEGAGFVGYNVALHTADIDAARDRVKAQALSSEKISGFEDPQAKIHLLRLESAGFAFVRLRRSACERAFEAGERFTVSDPDTGAIIECADAFGEMVEDGKHYSEDIAFWRRGARLSQPIAPKALVDFPTAHGWRAPGVNCPMFRQALNLPSIEETARGPAPRLVLAR